VGFLTKEKKNFQKEVFKLVLFCYKNRGVFKKEGEEWFLFFLMILSPKSRILIVIF
jgi:hypothetical protein